VAAPDLTDLIQVATLQTYAGSTHPYADIDPANVGAFARLGLDADTEALEGGEITEEMSESRQALGGS
ncbi:MAG: histidine kinase, partial [Thalassolituus sp.]